MRLLDNSHPPQERDGWVYVVRFPVGTENQNDVSRDIWSELTKDASAEHPVSKRTRQSF
jgi:hypothetical protein